MIVMAIKIISKGKDFDNPIFTQRCPKCDCVFTYQNDKTPVIEVLKEIQNKKTPEESKKVTDMPKTGDDTNLLLAFLSLGISAGCVIFVMTRKKKNRK